MPSKILHLGNLQNILKIALGISLFVVVVDRVFTFKRKAGGLSLNKKKPESPVRAVTKDIQQKPFNVSFSFWFELHVFLKCVFFLNFAEMKEYLNNMVYTPIIELIRLYEGGHML